LTSPFEYVKDIQQAKKDIVRKSENPEKAEAMYDPYIVNKALSFYPDSVLYANEMNVHRGLDKLLQFDYLINSIRSMNRKHAWIKKPEADQNIALLKEYFGMSQRKAEEALRVLTKDQLTEIRKRSIKGGT
jgi:hypothetical protein